MLAKASVSLVLPSICDIKLTFGQPMYYRIQET